MDCGDGVCGVAAFGTNRGGDSLSPSSSQVLGGVPFDFQSDAQGHDIFYGASSGHHGSVKIILEKHSEGYAAYPASVQGVVVGQGNTFEEALRDVQSAIRFHIETFGREALESESPALHAFIAEAAISGHRDGQVPR